MRLINVETLELEEFFEQNIPPYWILSHRWGAEEVSYKQFRKGLNKESAGYRKITEFCNFVKSGHDLFHWKTVEYAWIDTCCIDKRSSSELSEAINSMYQWYLNARRCVAYLADVQSPPSSGQDPASLRDELAQSGWFHRGWTLQELLAPRLVIFCDVSWRVMGHICTRPGPRDYGVGRPLRPCDADVANGPHLNDEISSITKIRAIVLGPDSTYDAPVAEKMSWAAHRRTTRSEDRAYCLIGLFGINMPLLYGEGRRAFQRLQEEIIKRFNDESIFAWTRQPGPTVVLNVFPLLADSPRYFEEWHRNGGRTDSTLLLGTGRPFTMTNNGLEIRTSLRRYSTYQMGMSVKKRFRDYDFIYILRLNCDAWGRPVDILLVRTTRSMALQRILPQYLSLESLVSEIKSAHTALREPGTDPGDMSLTENQSSYHLGPVTEVGEDVVYLDSGVRQWTYHRINPFRKY